MLATLRRAIRSLKRSPVYFTAAALSLALGIGLSAASFLFIDSFRHPYLPYADVDRLYFPLLRLGNQRTPPSLGELQRTIGALPAIEESAVTHGTFENVTIDGDETAHLVTRASSGFFKMIGITPTLGRLPNAEEERNASAAMVTPDVWRTMFGDAREIGNAHLEFEGRLVNVVGVLPRGTDVSFPGDIWVPFSSPTDVDELKQSGGLGASAYMGSAMVIVKLRPHVSSAAIDAQVSVAAAGLTRRFETPGSKAAPYQLVLSSIRPRPAQGDGFELLIVLIGFGVLVIAATNVAALSLARGLTRQRDYALRIALGASRAAIAGEVLAEVGVIAAVGAAGGVLTSRAMIGALTHIVPAELAARVYVVPEFSGRLFAFAGAALACAIVVAGAAPAWRASRVNPAEPLKDGAGTTTGRSRREFRILVVGELAVSMVLLMLASLMSLSVKNIASYDFGYDAQRLLEANVYMKFTKDTSDASTRIAAQLASLDRIRAADGVAAAATISGLGALDRTMRSDAMLPGDAPMPIEFATNVSAGFFSTLGVRLTQGRDFEEGDRENGGAVILSPRAASALFPHGGAVGRMVQWGKAWLPVVGVTGELELYFRNPDARDFGPTIYVSIKEGRRDGWGIVIRPVRSDPKLAHTLHGILRDALPPGASSQVRAWTDQYDLQIRGAKFIAKLFGFIATAAMLLGAGGLFSVVSYAVSQRMREFAVRRALGAGTADIMKVVLTYALEMSLAGTALGALFSFWASSGVSSFLYGVKNTDPVSLVVAEGVLLGITMIASALPALRATKANPVDVLRAA
jgi:putative ABC transport system permease protein